jgi:nucleoside-diphosphate-sugar epimerase
MRVLVTGGAGYLGSVVTHELLEQGHQVCILDSLLHSAEPVLSLKLHHGCSFVLGDIREPELEEKLQGTFDAVVHLAAIVGDPACARQPELTREVNLDSALRIFQLSRRWGAKRFVFASTCSNYGRMSSTDELATEESDLQPLSLYAETKVAVERSLLDADAEGSPAVTVLRFATLFGLSPRMRFDLTVNEFTMELATKGKLVVYGEQFWRPYTHVHDAARAVALVLKAPPDNVAGQVFNVGDNGQNYQKGQLVELICNQLPGQTEIEYVHRDEDPRDYRVSFEKIKQELGFRITRTVDDGIREIAESIAQGIITDVDHPRYRN